MMQSIALLERERSAKRAREREKEREILEDSHLAT